MYLNTLQLAESFGVTERAVENWIRDEGLLCTLDGDRRYFDRTQVVQWAMTRGLAVRAGFLAPQLSTFATGERLEPLLHAGGIWRGVRAADVLGLFERIVTRLVGITPEIRALLSERWRKPNCVNWAPIGGGFALPHPSERIALGRQSGALALVFTEEPVEAATSRVDHTPVTRLCFFVAPSPRAQFDLLARLSRALAEDPLRELIATGAEESRIFEALHAFDSTTASLESAAHGRGLNP